MICSTDIMNLKTDIIGKIGQKIIVRGSQKRNKVFEKEATIDKAYANIFTVKYNEGSRTATYSYTDVLTRTVDVQVLNSDNTYISLVPPSNQFSKKKINVSV